MPYSDQLHGDESGTSKEKKDKDPAVDLLHRDLVGKFIRKNLKKKISGQVPQGGPCAREGRIHGQDPSRARQVRGGADHAHHPDADYARMPRRRPRQRRARQDTPHRGGKLTRIYCMYLQLQKLN